LRNKYPVKYYRDFYISSKELSEWKAYFSIKKKEAERERKEQTAKAKAKTMNTL